MSNQRKRILSAMIVIPALVTACAVLVFNYPKAFTSYLRSSSETLGSADKASLVIAPNLSATAQSDARRRPSQMVNITLYEQGIYPHKIRVRPGRIIFSIDDRTTGSSGLIINSSTRQERIEKTDGRLRGKGVVELGVGQYEIADASRPENWAILIVDPN